MQASRAAGNKGEDQKTRCRSQASDLRIAWLAMTDFGANIFDDGEKKPPARSTPAKRTRKARGSAVDATPPAAAGPAIDEVVDAPAVAPPPAVAPEPEVVGATPPPPPAPPLPILAAAPTLAREAEAGNDLDSAPARRREPETPTPATPADEFRNPFLPAEPDPRDRPREPKPRHERRPAPPDQRGHGPADRAAPPGRDETRGQHPRHPERSRGPDPRRPDPTQRQHTQFRSPSATPPAPMPAPAAAAPKPRDPAPAATPTLPAKPAAPTAQATTVHAVIDLDALQIEAKAQAGELAMARLRTGLAGTRTFGRGIAFAATRSAPPAGFELELLSQDFTGGVRLAGAAFGLAGKDHVVVLAPASKSMLVMARALHAAGHRVEVAGFTNPENHPKVRLLGRECLFVP